MPSTVTQRRHNYCVPVYRLVLPLGLLKSFYTLRQTRKTYRYIWEVFNHAAFNARMCKQYASTFVYNQVLIHTAGVNWSNAE